MQLKRNTTCEKRWKNATTSAFGNSALILDESSDHGLGQRYEDIWMQSSGPGISQALLFRKLVPLGTNRWLEWLAGLVIINFGSKQMLLHFFQRFSHVVLRFSCMSPCRHGDALLYRV
jgi:hypothetical protein